MYLFAYFFSSAPGLMGLAVLAGLASGLGSAGLVAFINAALGADASSRVEAAWGFAALCLLVILARIAAALLVTRLGQAAIFKLRMGLSRRILTAPLRRLQALGAPRLLANLTEDISTIAEAFQWVPLLCVNGAIVLGCLVYLGWLSGSLLGLMLGIMAAGIVSFQAQARKASRRLHAAREYADALFRHLRGLMEGVKELKLSRQRREAFLSESLERTAEACRRYYLSGETTYILAANWGNGLFYVAIGLTLFVLPAWEDMGTETLTGYTLATLYMMTPLAAVLDGVPVLNRAGIALDKIEALGRALDTWAGEEDTAAVPVLPASSAVLELIQIIHRYHRENDDHPFTLGPLSLILHPGELIFVVGGNGSGKTTFALLLVGLYVPESGEIRLNGQPITDENREYYREHFSAVFSDFYLFESLLGLRGSELDEKARGYLVKLQLDHKMKIENGIFSTLDLSQGQRKRLALLTAYLEDRPFYVFDEWAADQDPAFKKNFYMEIVPSLKARGKTVLVITHDDSYFHLADRCIKLEEGRLTETTPAFESPPVLEIPA